MFLIYGRRMGFRNTMDSSVFSWIGMSHISGELKDSAKMFKDKARHLNWQALYRKYGPPVIIASVILFVLLLRYYVF